jgi:hypothetical protein
MTAFRVVHQQVARNRIAAAVAKKRLQDGIRDALIDAYTLEPGTPQPGTYHTFGECLTLAIGIADMLQSTEGVAEMQAAHSRCVAAAQSSFLWSAEDAAILDDGLTIAQQYVLAATPMQVQAIYRQMQ